MSTSTPIIELWGEDPVHPTPAAYQVLANKLVAMVDDMMAEATSPVPVTSNDTKKRAAHREPWIVSSEPVAKRLIPAGSEKPRGGNNSGRFNGGRGTGNRGSNRGPGPPLAAMTEAGITAAVPPGAAAAASEAR